MTDILKRTIRRLTTDSSERLNKDGTPNEVGLGQKVKVLHSGRYWELDFLSKWSFSDGTLDGWYLCRDLSKIMSKK